MSKRKVIIAIVVLAMVINSLSYSAALIAWSHNGENGAELEVRQPANEDGVMVYLVAGCGNQPEQAFELILPDLQEYGLTFVNYRPDRGCDMELIAKQVVENIEQNGYQKVLVIDCSIGDYVGRVCDQRADAYTIAFNPEPDACLLKPWAKFATRAGVRLADDATVLMGWLSQIPWYSDCGNHFSTTFMVSQFREIGYRDDVVPASLRMLGIIVAEADANGKGEDEFLQGREAMEAYFGDVDIYSAVGVGHANTVKGAEAYKAAWDQLWAKAKPRFDAG